MSISLLPQYWFVVAESHEITVNTVLARRLLDQPLVVYRDSSGTAVVAEDRCVHRCARLSSGTIRDGALTCGYHGWVYSEGGKVTCIPAEGGAPAAAARNLKAKTFMTAEQDGYVYVCLSSGEFTPRKPMSLEELGARWTGQVRLQNRFQNTLANCVENYIDVPHTAYVHHGIFRKPRHERLCTGVTRSNGAVHVSYRGERMNLGTFSFFLNRGGKEIAHSDHFYAPNITSVHYELPCGYRYSIISQSIPISKFETHVFTVMSYDFGIWTKVSKWLVRRQAQKVIDQDIQILNEQGANIRLYGERFIPTSADIIHTLTSEIIDGLERGVPPSRLSEETREVQFYV